MDEVKRLRAGAQKYTELARKCTERAQELTEQARHYVEYAAKRNKQADELEEING